MKVYHTRDSRRWLGLGLAAGAAAGFFFWLWQRTRPRRPLPAAGEQRGTALITGASSGIGEAFAHRLAREGYRLLLVARRQERLAALAEALQAQYGVAAEAVVADLADPAAVEALAQRIAACPDLTLLVNNAGFGLTGRFAEGDAAHQLAMIQVHMAATVRLTRAALPGMLARGNGALINVSSVAAFMPTGGNILYTTTKNALNTFSLTLAEELRGTGVQVQALCPGFTYTEFHDTQGTGRPALPSFLWMTAEAVVEHALRDLQRDQVLSIPGGINRLIVTLTRALPPRLFRLGATAVLSPARRRAGVPAFKKRTYRSWDEFRADLQWMQAHRGEVRAAMQQLTPAFRERLMLAVTAVNGCRYCSYYHSRLALEGGLSQDEINALLAGVCEDCPAEELPAVLYAQHWADTGGQPDPEAQARLLATYGPEAAAAIEVALRMIRMGNYTGNAVDALLYRLSGGRWGS